MAHCSTAAVVGVAAAVGLDPGRTWNERRRDPQMMFGALCEVKEQIWFGVDTVRYVGQD